jgi:hypothetical protein
MAAAELLELPREYIPATVPSSAKTPLAWPTMLRSLPGVRRRNTERTIPLGTAGGWYRCPGQDANRSSGTLHECTDRMLVLTRRHLERVVGRYDPTTTTSGRIASMVRELHSQGGSIDDLARDFDVSDLAMRYRLVNLHIR